MMCTSLTLGRVYHVHLFLNLQYVCRCILDCLVRIIIVIYFIYSLDRTELLRLIILLNAAYQISATISLLNYD